MISLRWIICQIRDFGKRNQANAVEAYAAQATLFVVISFFPAAILLLSLMPSLPLTEAQFTDVFLEIVPDAISDFMRGILKELYSSSSLSLISISALVALWSSSKGAVALMRGLDRIYGIHRTRNFLFWRLIASVYTLLFFLLLSVLLAFLGFGSVVFSWLSQWVPVLAASVFVKGTLQFIVSFAVLFLIFLLLYIAIPQRRTHLLREIPGALVAAAGWVGFSILYSYYLDHLSGISLYYGSLSLVSLSLLWLYFCMYIFFVGAEVNVWIQENLPPRKKKEKTKKKTR